MAKDDAVPTMGGHDSPEAVYDARKLGTPKMLVFGFQHMFAMFGATILVPILTGLSVSATLLFAGLGTLLFHFLSQGKVPAFLGSSFAFIAGYAAIAPNGEANLLPYACLGVAFAGLLYPILAALFKVFGSERVMKFFPPLVTGPIVIAIGLTLSSSAINNASTNWLVAVVAVAVIFIANIWGKGMVKIIPILLGVIVSYVFAAAIGECDFTSVQEAAWIGLPVVWDNTVFSIFGEGFDSGLAITAIITIMPLAFATMIEHIGDISAISSTCNRNYIANPGLHPAGRRPGHHPGVALWRTGQHHLRREHRRARAHQGVRPPRRAPGRLLRHRVQLQPQVRRAHRRHARLRGGRREPRAVRHDLGCGRA